MAEFRYQLKEASSRGERYRGYAEPLGAELGWSELKSAHMGSRLPKVNAVNYEVLSCTLVEDGGCLV